MKARNFLLLNVALATVVVLGLVYFRTMPPSLEIVWAVVTISLAAVVVIQGYRRFFSNAHDEHAEG